jgi:hypothetical protein
MPKPNTQCIREYLRLSALGLQWNGTFFHIPMYVSFKLEQQPPSPLLNQVIFVIIIAKRGGVFVR